MEEKEEEDDFDDDGGEKGYKKLFIERTVDELFELQMKILPPIFFRFYISYVHDKIIDYDDNVNNVWQ